MLGVGTDIVEIERIKKILLKYETSFVQKLLAPEEIVNLGGLNRKAEYIAGRFAAKEAVLKAFGTGLRNCSWRDIVITNDVLGKPLVELKGNLLLLANKKNITAVHISISHSRSNAVAFCIIE